MRASDSLRIGQVADAFGIGAHVLRHWESLELLVPARTTTGDRRYSTADLYRVAAILRAKDAGLGLEEIHALLTATDPVQRGDVLRLRRDEVRAQIAALQRSLDLLDTAVACRHGDLATCPKFGTLLASEVDAVRPVGGS